MSRPIELTPEVLADVVRLIEEGNSGEVAMQANGFHPTTFYQYMRRGKTDGEGIYYQFYVAATRARAQAEVYAVDCLRQGMKTDPKMAVEYLKRARWKRWEPAKRSDVKLTADYAHMSDEQIEQERIKLLEALTKGNK